MREGIAWRDGPDAARSFSPAPSRHADHRGGEDEGDDRTGGLGVGPADPRRPPPGWGCTGYSYLQTGREQNNIFSYLSKYKWVPSAGDTLQAGIVFEKRGPEYLSTSQVGRGGETFMTIPGGSSKLVWFFGFLCFG